MNELLLPKPIKNQYKNVSKLIYESELPGFK